MAESPFKILHLVRSGHAGWKKPERKRKKLIRLGLEKGLAYAYSRTNMGGWAVAQSPILYQTITPSRLRKKGYESMLDYYLKTQPQIQ